MNTSKLIVYAMLGYTPVSALLHSFTLVCGGVIMLIKYGLENDPLLIILGLFTVISSSISSIKQNDLKKIIALSTNSQIGIVTISIGLGGIDQSYSHIISHGLLKAYIFVELGKNIKYDSNNQNINTLIHPIKNEIVKLFLLAITAYPYLLIYLTKENILILDMHTIIYILLISSS